MKPEVQLAEFVTQARRSDVSPSAVKTAQRVLLAAVGAGIAGAEEDGIAALRQLLRDRGGRAEAATFVYGDVLPAHAAAQFNGTLCRALDFCDAMAPGAHFGSSLIPAASAAAALVGGCSGEDFLMALVVGGEVGARMNLTEAMYDGFDPTGVAAVFAATAASARLLGLSTEQTVNALGLAFNRCGGSFQSNVDGALAVRVIQGWVAQTGIECAQLAQVGITGPPNFIGGVYGYAHLFGRDTLDPDKLVAGLGAEWKMNQAVFKKYPSCGATQGMTELALNLVDDLDLRPEVVDHVEVRLNPYCYRLVGGEFEPGTNVRVNAQFSAQYCIANAIVRGSSKLTHFRPQAILDPSVQEVLARVSCVGDPALDSRGHTAVDVTVKLRDGRVERRELDLAPGFPGNELTDLEHQERFQQCLDYAALPVSQSRVDEFLTFVDDLDSVADARQLTDLVVAGSADRAQPVAV